MLSDQVKVKITSNPGETFLDRMIALVEGAERQKTPNEIALNILIAGLTLIFLLAVVSLQPFAGYANAVIPVPVLVALLVCLIPTTIGGLLSAIGIAGMDRVMQHNVLAMSGRAVEASGDVNTLLLDKTGTITMGNRQAVEFIAAAGVAAADLADAAQLSSLADETPEGRSIVVLAKEKYNLRGREVAEKDAHFIPFSAYTRMSGVDIDGRQLRKGATEAVIKFVEEQGGQGAAQFQGFRRTDFPFRRNPLSRGRRYAPAWRDPPERHRERRHERAHRPTPRHGNSQRDDNGRQSVDRRGHRGPRLALTIFWRKPLRKTSWNTFARNRRRAAWLP